MKFTGLMWERVYPYAVAFVSTAIWIYLLYEHVVIFPESDAVLSSTLTVSGIFVGFLATCKAILISMDSPVLRDLAQTNYIDDLVSYIGQAIWLNLMFCLVNVVGFFCRPFLYSALWMFFAVCALMTFIRVTAVMLTIFKYSQRKEDE